MRELKCVLRQFCLLLELLKNQMSHLKCNLCLRTHGHTYLTILAATKRNGFPSLLTCLAVRWSKSKKFSDLGWNHLFYLDEEKKTLMFAEG